MSSSRLAYIVAAASLLALVLAYTLQFTSGGTITFQSSGSSRHEIKCDASFTRPDVSNISQPQLADLRVSAMELPRLFEAARMACADFLPEHNDGMPCEFQTTDGMVAAVHYFYASSAHDLPTALSARNHTAIKSTLWHMGMALRATSEELGSQSAYLWPDSKISALESLVLRAVYCSRWNVVSNFLADIWLHFFARDIRFQHSEINGGLAIIERADTCQSAIATVMVHHHCWKNNLLRISSSVRSANEHLVHFWEQQQAGTDCNSDCLLRAARDACARILTDFDISDQQAEQQCFFDGY